MMKTKANNEGECLDKLSRYQETIKVAIFRSSDGVCGYLSDPDDLKEDTKQGQSASVFLFPLNNLHRVKQELTLDQIHDAYLQNRARIYLFDGDYHVRMKIVDVVDKTKKETGLKDDVTSQIRSQAKLKIDDQFTLSVPDVKTFADCYRNCHDKQFAASDIAKEISLLKPIKMSNLFHKCNQVKETDFLILSINVFPCVLTVVTSLLVGREARFSCVSEIQVHPETCRYRIVGKDIQVNTLKECKLTFNCNNTVFVVECCFQAPMDEDIGFSRQPSNPSTSSFNEQLEIKSQNISDASIFKGIYNFNTDWFDFKADKALKIILRIYY
uniref:Uncharacterized protein n=1 Tax=Tetranychus urticae TaxID=32264 RepID=T1L6D9_TETUR